MSKRHPRRRHHAPRVAPPPATLAPPANVVRPGAADPLRSEPAPLVEALGELLSAAGASAPELPRVDAADPLRALVVEVLEVASTPAVRAPGEAHDASATRPAPAVPADTWEAMPGGAFRVRTPVREQPGPQVHHATPCAGSAAAGPEVARVPAVLRGGAAASGTVAPGAAPHRATGARHAAASVDAPVAKAQPAPIILRGGAALFASAAPVAAAARAARTAAATDAPAAAELTHRLTSVLAPGESVWLDALGYRFLPLSRLARAARLEVCAPHVLRPGDFAVVKRSDGQLAAQVVLAPGGAPSAPFLADPEASSPLPLARVAAVRVLGREVVLGSAARGLTRLARAGGRALKGLGLGRMRLVLQALWDRLPPVLWVRERRVAPYAVRALVPSDADAVRALVRRELPLQEAYVLGQLGERFQTKTVAIGAWDKRGAMVGLMYLGDYRDEGLAVDGIWLRSLVVSRRARGLGVARRMCEEAEWHARRLGFRFVKADLRADNAPVLHLLERWGFLRAPAADEAAFNAACVAQGAGGGWVVYQHALPEQPQFLPRSLP